MALCTLTYVPYRQKILKMKKKQSLIKVSTLKEKMVFFGCIDAR